MLVFGFVSEFVSGSELTSEFVSEYGFGLVSEYVSELTFESEYVSEMVFGLMF